MRRRIAPAGVLTALVLSGCAADRDLGLSEPLTDPPCTGGYVLTLAVANGSADVRREIDLHPGASYLYGPHSCASLDAPGYLVYDGPYPDAHAACVARDPQPGETFLVRRLDDDTDVDPLVVC